MSETIVRTSTVAGQFYPSTAAGLKKEIAALCTSPQSKREVIACMVPHAGYMYSGAVAVATIQNLVIKDTVILLGPNHTGRGAPYSIMQEGLWQTPLGEVKINTALTTELLANSSYLKNDSLAHAHEHSLEVELPILQYFRPEFKIVPIAFLSDDVPSLKKTGREIAFVIKESPERNSIMLLASSDMTHYEPQKEASRKDHEAIRSILALDEDALAEKITRNHISMCGYAPCIVMLAAAKALGARHAELIKYLTSGDVTGDTESVVGYAGVTIW